MSARAWTAFAAVSTLWGIPYLFIKVAVDDGVPPIFLAWSRVVARRARAAGASATGRACCAGLARRCAGCRLRDGRDRPAVPADRRGEQHVASSLAAILIAAVPMVVALLALRFDRPSARRAAAAVGLVIGFAGVVALVGLDVSGSAAELLGALAILLAAVGYAAGPMIIKPPPAPSRPARR